MDPETFRRLGHQLIDWIADYRTNLEQLPVMAPVEPGDIHARLPSAPPESAESLDGIFAEIERTIVPGLSLWQHPQLLRLLPGQRPARKRPRRLPQHRSRRPRSLLAIESRPHRSRGGHDRLVPPDGRSLSDAWSGVIQDTASTSTLVALICARERTSDFSLAGGGLQGLTQPLVVYASRQAHSSVDKAALLAGFGRDNLRWVDTDDNHGMRPDALAAAIAADLARGARSPAPSSPPSAPPRRRRSTRSRRSRRSPGNTASGCTSTPRWPVRR